VDKTYLEGSDTYERFGFATTRDVKTTPRNRDINQLEDGIIEDEPFDDEPFDGELIED